MYRFDADAGGASKITLTDAINITHNNLEVNLNGFVVPSQGMLLFDGDQALAGNRIFGTFDNLTVDGTLNPANYSVTYNQALGDILLTVVPEPASVAVLAGRSGAADPPPSSTVRQRLNRSHRRGGFVRLPSLRPWRIRSATPPRPLSPSAPWKRRS